MIGSKTGANGFEWRALSAEPVIITYYCDRSATFEGGPDRSISGSLMTSSSTGVCEPAEIRDISGTIDGTPAGGWAVHQEGIGNPPLFRVLEATKDEDGRCVAVFEGQSDVQWQLVVKGESDVLIRTKDATAPVSNAVFSKGTFRVEVSVPKSEGKKRESAAGPGS